jgi:hypothetical protein
MTSEQLKSWLLEDDWFSKHHSEIGDEFLKWWLSENDVPEKYEDKETYRMNCAFAWMGWKNSKQSVFLIEPKTGKQIGVWFENEEVWMYRGTLPVVIHFHPREGGFITEEMRVSRCPSCERGKIMVQVGITKVKRWMILPK